MDVASASSVVCSGLAFGGMLLAFFWKGDEAISAELRHWLSRALKGLDMPNPETRLARVFTAVFDRTFGADPLSFRFISRSIILSLVAIAVFSATYLIMYPGFWSSLVHNPFQRQQVARQMFKTALLVNLAVDFLCLAYCRNVVFQMTRAPRLQALPIYLLKDLAMKSVIFIVAMGFVYVGFATTAGAFGSDVMAAAEALPLTLWDGLRFGDLSAVYLYSALVSSFWLWGYLGSWLLIRAAATLPQFLAAIRWTLPLDEHPVRSLGLVTSLLGMIGYWAVLIPARA